MQSHTLSEQAVAALHELEDGWKMNCTHTIARELIAAGLAYNEFGYLALTDSGRRAARRAPSRRVMFEAEGDQMAEIYIREDSKITQPSLFDPPLQPSPPPVIRPTPLPSSELDPPACERERVMRAAGVATGVTGIEPDVAWVLALIDALSQ
jgi:hypothetical protein